MKILLINPPSKTISLLDKKTSFLKFFSLAVLDKELLSFFPFECLSLSSLSANLKKAGHSVKILDACLQEMTSIDEVIKETMKENYDLIGFTGPQPVFRENIWIAQRLRRLGISAHFTVGGDFASINHYELLKRYSCFDSVVRGEGEITIVELANNLEKNAFLQEIKGLSYRDKESQEITINSDRGPIQNLDFLPFPDRSKTPLVIAKGFAASVYSSRGCGHSKCSFCTIATLSRTLKLSEKECWRYRSPGNIVDEIEWLVHKFRINKISFGDNHFLGAGEEGRSRAIEIVNQIRKRKLNIKFIIFARADDIELELFKILKQGGLEWVFIGLESGVQRLLDIYNKQATIDIYERSIAVLRKLQIKLIVGFVLFDPFSSFEELIGSFKYLESLEYYDLYKYLRRLQIVPKSEIFNLLNSQSRLSGDFLKYDYEFSDERIKILYDIQWRYARCIFPLYKAFVKKKTVDRHKLKVFLKIHTSLFNKTLGLLLKKGIDNEEEIRELILLHVKQAKNAFSERLNFFGNLLNLWKF